MNLLSLYKSLKFLLLFGTWLFIATPTFAQPDDADPVSVPIDGGLSLLVAAGVAYGVKKVHGKSKQNKTVEK